MQYSDAVLLLSSLIYVVSAFDPDGASRAFAALIHDRSMSWGERTLVAARHGQPGDDRRRLAAEAERR